MTDATKIMFSKEELEMVKDVSWVLTKREILDKVAALLNQQIQVIAQLFTTDSSAVDASILSSRPKISKGENYRLLPYMILDYPAVFSKENVFALRTMFWWGHFLSITLHLSGSYKKLYNDKLIKWLSHEEDSSLYVCVNTEQWEHHFEPHNYIPIKSISNETVVEVVDYRDFVKIAYKFELQDWCHMQQFLKEGYTKLVGCLAG